MYIFGDVLFFLVKLEVGWVDLFGFNGGFESRSMEIYRDGHGEEEGKGNWEGGIEKRGASLRLISFSRLIPLAAQQPIENATRAFLSPTASDAMQRPGRLRDKHGWDRPIQKGLRGDLFTSHSDELASRGW